jgi:hypothetical protein
MKRALRLGTWARRARPSEEATRWLARLLRSGGPAVHDLFREGGETHGRHPGARMLSMNAATSSISRLSSSSASRVATSAASAPRRRRRLALSRIARRIASDRLMPVASSCASACMASVSRRTLIADDMLRVYHIMSYSDVAANGLRMMRASETARSWHAAGTQRARGRRQLVGSCYLTSPRLMPTSRNLVGAGEGNRTLMTSLEGWGSAIELRPRARRETNFAAGEHRQRTGNGTIRPNCGPAAVRPGGEWERWRAARTCGAVGYGSAQRDVAQLG